MEKGLFLHYPTKAVKAEIEHLYQGAKKDYNGYMTVTLDKPYNSRTTGPGSQNNLFWKLVQIICNENGEEPKETERQLKEKAIAKGYPYHVSTITGKPVPESMTTINTVEMSYEGDGVINPIEKSFTFTVDANIDAPTIYNYQPAIINVYFGDATGKASISLGNKSYDLDMKNGVVTAEFDNYVIGDNTLKVTYSGDDTFNPFETTKVFTVLDKEDAEIISSVYKTANKNYYSLYFPLPAHHSNVTYPTYNNGIYS
jgi:hypothetical protein